ncbi:tripartite motif-containing protein 2 [Elysia marginata]|uniref:Tripartite motif-containing protein 2 n=1 Tax=Elysia marginata TaxID=1093978 RepID=A0AAV4ELL7_9GAST|nr:tripartite motif-containing protein 2 [Elysia marginata]
MEHMGHITVILSEAVPEHKHTLTSLVSKVRQLTPEIERAVEDVEDVCKQLELNTLSAEVKISTLFSDLSAMLEDRKQEMLSELAQASSVKENVLLEQKHSLEDQLARMERCCSITEDTLKSGKDTDIVMVKKEMTGKVRDSFLLSSLRFDFQSFTDTFPMTTANRSNVGNFKLEKALLKTQPSFSV